MISCATDSGPVSSSPGTTFGKIHVDTPEVYSRERLVNDRFQQDAWLREKLREKPTQGIQGSTGISSSSNTSFALAAGVKPQTPQQQQLEKSKTPHEVVDTPIEQLRDAMAYREEVRNEILENQLDDRHDIAGNTLYRLKFDATVVPHHDTSAYAMVEVTITGPSVWDISDADEKPQAPRDIPNEAGELDERTYELLMESEYARYVAGLDEETFLLYSQAYDDWVREIDADEYSWEDILFGPLQGYLDYEDQRNPPIKKGKTTIQWFKSSAMRDAAQEVLMAHGIPRVYHLVGGMEGGKIYLGINTGLANFVSDLRDHNTVIYTYAVTPKERVQRIYGNTLAAKSMGVSVGAEEAGLGASLAHTNAREARANAIMRQPQLVGYSPEAHRSGEATMGWLIGARYRISNDSKGLVSFRHVPAQHTLTGIISVPSWWTELNLVTKTYWLDESGHEFTQEGKELIAGVDPGTGMVTTIALPADPASIVDILDPKRREPRVTSTAAIPSVLMACEQGAVIIQGSQLWRSTVVTLGGQVADSISVLPNMRGIIATFNLVDASKSGTESLYLWTSEGEENAGSISVKGECKKNRDLDKPS